MQLPYKRYPMSTIRCRCRDAQLYNIGIFQGCMLCWQVSAAVHCSGPLAMASPITIFKCIIVPAALVCRKDTEAKHPKLIASPAGHQWVLLQYREGSTQPITGVTQSLLLRAMITRSVCVRLAQVSVHYPGYACTEHFFVIPSIRPPGINRVSQSEMKSCGHAKSSVQRRIEKPSSFPSGGRSWINSESNGVCIVLVTAL